MSTLRRMPTISLIHFTFSDKNKTVQLQRHQFSLIIICFSLAFDVMLNNEYSAPVMG